MKKLIWMEIICLVATVSLHAQTFTLPKGTTSNQVNGADITGAPAVLPTGSTFNHSGTITNLAPNSVGAILSLGGSSTTINLDGGVIDVGGTNNAGIWLGNGVDTINIINNSRILVTNGTWGVTSFGGNDTMNVTDSSITINGGLAAILTGAGTDTLIIQTSSIRGLRSNQAIAMGPGAGDRLILNGFSSLSGRMNGGPGGGDTLTLNNWRGFSQADANALTAAQNAVAVGVTKTVTLNGVTFQWVNFEALNITGFQTYSNLITVPGLGGFANALDNINSVTTEEFRDILRMLNRIPEGDLNELAKTASGQIYHHALSSTAFNNTTRFTSDFFNHLRQLNLNAEFGATDVSELDWNLEGLDPMLHQLDRNLTVMNNAGLAVSDTGSQAAAIAAAQASSGSRSNYDWHTFVQGSGGIATQDSTSAQAESEYVSTSGTIGMGRNLNESLAVGAYVGYQGIDGELDSFGSELNGAGAQVGGFARYQWEDWLASGIVGYNYMSYDAHRTMAAGALTRTAESNPDSHQFISALELARNFYFGDSQSWRVTPLAGVQYSLLEVGAFGESGLGAADLRFGDQTAHSLRTRLGFEVSKVMDGDWGWIAPYVSASWNREFLDNSRDISTSFGDNAVGSFTVSTEDADENFGLVGVGFNGSLTEAENIHFTLGWQVQFGQEGYLANSATGGIRIDL